MRLTHLKLAGFKSFVDATTLHIHGQRVGVVGPNGCGKSNVMESVRWVLGESSAKEMRGDSMDAVIFNGSGNRKAISRASVELIFDNSLGGAVGNWSQYAEISVKRVIEREKGSTYYINNTTVRRRDVADLFLGTGLGGRAYAIIGQNTINRIVEAKPEELRVFLEEAAGISKYKERRRETELRLRDTRENLIRVEDILRELTKQITRLASQALVTEQYHCLQAALKLTQGQFWLIKKRDGGTRWEKSQRLVEKLVNELEAQMAALRSSESTLATMRQAHFSSTEGVNKAQASYYEANAEASNLEQQVRHTAEARERVQMQLLQITALTAKNTAQSQLLQLDLEKLSAEHIGSVGNEQRALSHLKQVQQALPKAEVAFQAAVTEHAKNLSSLLETEQCIRLETTSIGHVAQHITDVQQRLERFSKELTGLSMPSLDELLAKQAVQHVAQLAIADLEKNATLLREQDQLQQLEMKTIRENQALAQRQLNQVEAEIVSLTKLHHSFEKSAGGESKLKHWLNQAGLQDNKRLWQQISIKKGWGVALESVLGVKLNAIISVDISHLANYSRPPAALVVTAVNAKYNAKESKSNGLVPILSMIEYTTPELNSVMLSWLDDVYLLSDGDDAFEALAKINIGEMLVNEHGDIYTQQCVAYHGVQSNLHGILEQQNQLAELKAQLPALQETLNAIEVRFNQADQALQALKSNQQSVVAECADNPNFVDVNFVSYD